MRVHYSFRSATIGSTLAARLAGMTDASSAARAVNPGAFRSCRSASRKSVSIHTSYGVRPTLLYESSRPLVPGDRQASPSWVSTDCGVGWQTEENPSCSRFCLLASMALIPVAQPSAQGPGQTPSKPAKLLSLAQVWTMNGTYNDPQHGVSFRYPAVWQATTQFANHPPALTQSDAVKPIAGFGYSEGGFPRKQLVGPYGRTNLEGVGIVYAAVPAASAAACKATAKSVSGSPEGLPVTFGERSFSVYKTESAGMSQIHFRESLCHLRRGQLLPLRDGCGGGFAWGRG